MKFLEKDKAETVLNKNDFYHAMGFYVGRPPVRGAEGRLWAVYRLNEYYYILNSRAGGRYHLDYSGGRLVGEAPKAPRAETLEQRV